MSNEVNMNIYLHSLLVIKQINNFTISEARSVLLEEFPEFNCAIEARKYIYRQIHSAVQKGLLFKETDDNQEVRYSKTQLFSELKFKAVKRPYKFKNKKHSPLSTQTKATSMNIDYEKELKKELLVYEIDLNTLLEEAKEYKRMLSRFPNLKEQLKQHQTVAQRKSIQLLGKIHAIQNLLGHTLSGRALC